MLLDEIISVLSDERGTLNSALLKTKVLLHSLGKKELVTWVTNELKGYPDVDSIPDYRVVTATVHSHVISLAWQMRNYVLPIMHLTDKQRNDLTSFRCTLSIPTIEETIRNYHEKGTLLARQLPPEYATLFQNVLTPGTNIISVWCECTMMDVENILSEVRSRLLDFVLELRDVVGIDVPEKELAAKAATVDAEKMFSTSIYGSGNTIIIASQHVQSITNQKDDIEGLIAAIGELGFQQQELKELREAVIQDATTGKRPDVAEGKTGQWFIRALKEASKGVVKAGVDVVSTVIIKAIKDYNGAP